MPHPRPFPVEHLPVVERRPSTVVVEQAMASPSGSAWLQPTWRATAEVQASGYRLPSGVSTYDEAELREAFQERLEALGQQLAVWLLNLGPRCGLQLGLHGVPDAHRLEISLRLQLDEHDEESARRQGTERRRQLLQILEGAGLVRVGAAAPAPRTPTTGRLAVILPELLGGRLLPAPRTPHGAHKVDALVTMLLAQPGPCSVLLHARPVPREDVAAASESLVTEVSGRYAWALGHVEGVRVTHRDAYSHTFPSDLLMAQGIKDRCESVIEHLQGLGRGTLDLRVAVVGSERPGDPLVHAAAEALLGADRVGWTDLTEDQARLLAEGPLTHCPPWDPDQDGLLSRWTPARAAVSCLCLPTPGPAGLPGLPLSAMRRRPADGRVLRGDGRLLGEGLSSSRWRPVRIADTDLARHLYLNGKTGVGKSTLLQSLICDLALAGEGVGLIDPHGDLVEACRTRIGSRRRVVVFDPADPACPSLDPLAHDGTLAGIERAAEEITAVMFRLYPTDYMGPAFDRHSRALLFPLMAAGRPLADISRFHNDRSFRQECLRELDRTDPLHDEIHRFWEKEYPNWGSQYRSEMQSYVLSKYEALVKSSILRRVCDRERDQLDLYGLLDRGDVLLVKLSEGVVGQVSAWFLGMLLVGRLKDAVFARSAIREGDRSPFTLVMDEFQHLVGGGGFGYTDSERTLAPMLSEARKFGLRLVLSHQFTSQLDSATREAIFGNVGSMITFRVGSVDAAQMATELGGGVTPRELQDLPLFHAAARLLCDGETAPVFTLRTIAPVG